MGLRAMPDLLKPYSDDGFSGEPRDALDLLIRLFVRGDFVPATAVDRFIGAGTLNNFRDFGLVEGADPVAATVSLYPTHDLWIASDRWNKPDRSPIAQF